MENVTWKIPLHERNIVNVRPVSLMTGLRLREVVVFLYHFDVENYSQTLNVLITPSMSSSCNLFLKAFPAPFSWKALGKRLYWVPGTSHDNFSVESDSLVFIVKVSTRLLKNIIDSFAGHY